MKVEYTTWRGTQESDLVEYCEGSLQGDGEGEMETLRDQVNNNSVAIAKLIDLLTEKGRLSLAEVERVLTTYDDLKLAK